MEFHAFVFWNNEMYVSHYNRQTIIQKTHKHLFYFTDIPSLNTIVKKYTERLRSRSF